jgi:hypothetical protein
MGNSAEALIEWFWKYGVNREGLYAVPVEACDAIYEARRLLALADPDARSARPAVGIWGPSRSGKSTLISSLIDDADGKDSAVNWTPDRPTCFVRQEPGSTVIPLNPFNFGSDASGCVTRFVMRGDADSVDREYPVRLTLGGGDQFMHALTAGFLAEADTRRNDQDVIYFEEPFTKLLGERRALRSSDHELFEDINRFADVVQQLIAAGEDRFRNLGANDRWRKSIRKSMLTSALLLSSQNAFETFAFDVLWNGSGRLTDVYRQLVDVAAKFRGKSVFCSLEVAALLLDIDAYKYIQDTEASSANAERRRLADLASRLSWTTRDGKVVIGRDLPQRLVRDPFEFGLFQGAVWEIEVPLRQDYIVRRAGESTASKNFLEFLKRADLIDFPGVALEDAKKVDPLDLQSDNVDRSNLLTTLLKRGKTISIVSSYARSLALDEFLILVRAGNFPAKPTQLSGQIGQWWAAADQSFSALARNRADAPLPVVVAMTFFAKVINDCERGIGNGLDPVFGMLSRLGAQLTSPDLVTLMALSYPAFNEGRISVDDNIFEKILGEIRSDVTFKTWFAGEVSRGSFEAMVANARSKEQDGGVGYLFEQLLHISSGPRLGHLERIRREVYQQLETAIVDHLPPVGEGPEPGLYLRKFAETVRAYISAAPDFEEFDRCVESGRLIRRIASFSIDEIEPLPLNVPEQTRVRELRNYVGRQFEAWKSARSQLNATLGHEEIDVRKFVYALGELTLKTCGDALATWLRQEIPYAADVDRARYAREYVAVALSNAIFSGPSSGARGRPQQKSSADNNGERRLLEFMRQGFTRERSPRSFSNVDFLTVISLQSPEYRMIIGPFLARLDQLATEAPVKRPPQAGDDQLQQIYEQMDGSTERAADGAAKQHAAAGGAL